LLQQNNIADKKALIVFARKPVAGAVKTRLAATIGNEKALNIYVRLLKHTKNVITPVNCDKYVFLTESGQDNFWAGFINEVQQGDTLGARMHNAFELLFSSGYNKVLIIGSDCPHLTTNIVEEGFNKLISNDIVIGPATDGGYYMLGMKKLYQKLFENKSWSTAFVFDDTMRDIVTLALSHHLLPELSDVDEEKDVPAEWLL